MYKRFQSLAVDTAPVGLARVDLEEKYFCTPLGAEIIGWEVGGIHCCFLPAYGEMVFAVNPMPCVDQYVYPLARTFEDFLRLLLAAKSTTALEQIVWWDREQYEGFIRSPEEVVSASRPEVTEVLTTLQNTFGLTPMEDVFGYVKTLQGEFDGSGIMFSEEYYDLLGIQQ